ncbi:TIGR02266 family protein [Desulfuromonas sp. CSMB_57]|jgi:uncharacterized protein (TIGR02266 family)|uniref:TIGR02266 family protein n=1 Tax=Desulfuromonas sp. CSMB_57 TaxID=2807629 RepID=UPI001CD6475A|nr:TIGR02266 family protein [Desulfuromonas sp. CSMB_57]
MELAAADQIKVLLADDSESLLEMEKSFFRRQDFRVLLADNGRRAYEIVLSEEPDIVFLDLNMPEMAGDEVCLRIKSHAVLCNVPVLLLIQSNSPEDLLRCRHAGCDGVLLKPPRQHLFLQAVEKHLQVPRRAAPRVEMRLQVRFRLADGEHYLTDYTVNVSTGGFFLESQQPLPPGTPLSLEFSLPGHTEPIRCSAQVAWVNQPTDKKNRRLPAGMGVQFQDLSLKDMSLIRSFVTRALVTPEW